MIFKTNENGMIDPKRKARKARKRLQIVYSIQQKITT